MQNDLITSSPHTTYMYIESGDGLISPTENEASDAPVIQEMTEPGMEVIRVRLPKKRLGEQFAVAETMLGGYHIKVRCYDGVTRLGRIKGKIKKRAWIRVGDIVIVTPWSFQDEKCDISYRYTPPQRDWLKRNNYL